MRGLPGLMTRIDRALSIVSPMDVITPRERRTSLRSRGVHVRRSYKTRPATTKWILASRRRHITHLRINQTGGQGRTGSTGLAHDRTLERTRLSRRARVGSHVLSRRRVSQSTRKSRPSPITPNRRTRAATPRRRAHKEVGKRLTVTRPILGLLEIRALAPGRTDA